MDDSGRDGPDRTPDRARGMRTARAYADRGNMRSGTGCVNLERLWYVGAAGHRRRPASQRPDENTSPTAPQIIATITPVSRVRL